MRRVVFFVSILLMLLWTAVLAADLVLGILSDDTLINAATGESPVQATGMVMNKLWGDLWGAKAQARAIVWGIPMVVFSLIAAISQR